MKIDFRKGSGEALAFAYVAPLLCFLIIEICGIVQYNFDSHQMLSALDAAGRAAVVCTNIDDAKTRSLMIAQTCITSNNISNVSTEVEYATDDDTWQSGLLLKVTIKAKIESMSLLLQPKVKKNFEETNYEKCMIYSVEGTAFSNEEVALLATTLYMEGGSTDESMLAVGTIIMNRVDSPLYPNTLAEVIYAPNQFEVTTFTSFNNYMTGKITIPDKAIKVAKSVLSGSRDSRLINPNCYEFRTHKYFDENGHFINTENYAPNGIDIGGNWFFW